MNCIRRIRPLVTAQDVVTPLCPNILPSWGNFFEGYTNLPNPEFIDEILTQYEACDDWQLPDSRTAVLYAGRLVHE